MTHLSQWLLVCLFCLAVAGLSAFVDWRVLLMASMVLGILLWAFLKYERCLFVCILLVPVAAEAIGFNIRAEWNFPVGLRPINLLPLALPFIVIFYGGLLIKRWARTEEKPGKNPLAWPGFILLFYASLTVAWSPNLPHSLLQLMLLTANLMLLALPIHAMKDQKSHRKVLWFWVVWGGFQGIIAILLYFMHPQMLTFEKEVVEGLHLSFFVPAGGYQEHRLIRRGAIFANPLESAMIMNMVFAVAQGMFLQELNRVRRCILAAVMVLAISVVLLSMSRQGLASLVVMQLFLLFMIKRLRRHLLAYLGVFIVTVVSLYQIQNSLLNAYFKHSGLPSRIMVQSIETSGGAPRIAGTKPRLALWKHGFDRLRETAFMGGGVGDFKRSFKAPHAHSIYFSFLFDFGLVGLGVVACILLVLFKKFLAGISPQQTYLQIASIAFMGGLIAAGMHGLVDFEYNRPILWLYLGMAFATFSLSKQEIQGRVAVSQEGMDPERPVL